MKRKKPKKRSLEWETVRKKVNDLIPYSKNPNKMSEEQASGMERSLTKFNLVELPAINLDGTIVAGHQRIKTLQLLGRGEEKIEVRIPNRQLTDKEFRDYLLTSNRSGGDFDWDLLKANFDMEELLTAGFDATDLSHIFDDNLSVEDDGFDEVAELKKIKKTDIKPGDLFSLGSHLLICSDSTDPDTVKKLVGKEKVNLINIDFPYNIGVDYSKGIGGKQNYGGTTNDRKSDVEYRQFLKSILQNALSVSKDDCHVFAWLDEKYLGMLQEIYKELEISFKRLCFWIKGSHNPTPQIAFNRAVELCLYGLKGKPFLSEKIKNLTEIQNKEVETGNRMIDDIMDIFQLWLVKRLPGNEYQHSTMKPPTLYEKSIRRCSKPGDIILDLTAGSGSLLIACEALKRQARLAEIEPIFCQLIINRFKQLSPNEKVRKLN